MTVAGSSSVTINDIIDTRGASGATGINSSGGGNVSISSAGPVLAGNIFASGASANAAAPSGAGAITVTGAGVATGQLWVDGGSRTGAAAGPGAGGNLVSVTSTGPALGR